MSLIRWKPKNYNSFQELFDWDEPLLGLSLFPIADKSLTAFKRDWSPAIDLSEDKDNVILKADLPGLNREDIRVSIDDNILTIKGERKSENEKKGKNFQRIERFSGYFQRSLDLGESVDPGKVKASYKNGVLEVILPKTEQKKSEVVDVEVK